MNKVKESWEYWGENDPYFAVATFDKFRMKNLTESNKEDFFQTGFDHIHKLWDEIESNLTQNFQPRTALDFGCGVGRIVVPLAEKCETVWGVDISEMMLEEAAHNCETRKISNAHFLQTDEFLSETANKFDFIHSFIVLQHINPVQGEKIIEKMLKSLSENGVGVLHFVYSNSPDDRNFWKFKIYRDYPLVNKLRILAKGGKTDPLIPMYIYDLNRVFSLLQENDCHKCSVRFSFHGMQGIVLFFQKAKSLTY